MLDSALRRQQKIRDLHKQYDLLSQKIQRLNEHLIVANDPSTELKLEWQIREAEERLQHIEREIDALEQIDVMITLRTALLKLNYHAQVGLFLRLIEKSKVGAFLIRGEANYGQRWLLNRLVSRVLQSSDDLVIPLAFCSWQRWNLDVILRRIGEKISLKSGPSLHEVVERLHQCWQKQTVVLIFHHVGDVHPDTLRELKEMFWHELARKTREQPSQREKAKLLMFLVDDTGSLETWPFDSVDELDASWTPDMPVKPPVIAPIDVAELAGWIQYASEELPSKIREMPVQDIWQQTNAGTPQMVLEHLCGLGDCDWSELERLWVKY